MSFEERINKLMASPEELKVEGSEDIFPNGSNCFSVVLYVLGLKDAIISADYTRKILEELLDGLPFHDIESAHPGDLVIFEYPYTGMHSINGRLVEVEINLSWTELSHAAIYLGQNSVFQQNNLNGPVGKGDLSSMINHYADVKLYSPKDLKLPFSN